MNSYSVDTYDYLKAIGTTTIKDGYIDTSLLPDDVAEYDISYDKYAENTVYTYSLDVTNNLLLVPTPEMTITLSKKYEILSEDCTYSSEEKYVNSITMSIYANSILYGFCFWICIVIVFPIICFIAYQISKSHKKRDSEKNDSSDTN